MTLTECLTRARELSRVDSTAIADARVQQLIQEAVTEFAVDVGGFSKQDYPAISATFDTDTHFAIRVTIVGGTNALTATDVAITGTARSGATGAQVATDFQTTLQAAIGGGASATVTYDDFAFTVDTIDGTSITFAEPSDVNYADARDLLGLSGTTTEAAADVTGNFPEDCTLKYTLPTDLITLQGVDWEGNRLVELEPEITPQATGTPYGYFVRERQLYFIPAPDDQGLCTLWYRGTPTDIDFGSDTNLPSDIPTAYHQAIPHLVAYYMLISQFDEKLAGLRRAEYAKLMRQFRVSRHNRQTLPTDPSGKHRRWYKVDMS